MPTSSNNELSVRVRRTLEDLAVIRQTLLAGCEECQDSAKEPNQVLDLELASELKAVVDALRRLLWAYMQALSAKSGRSPHEVMNWYKMEFAVEMLRSVRAHTQTASSETAEPGYSFDQLVSNALAVTSHHTEKEPRLT